VAAPPSRGRRRRTVIGMSASRVGEASVTIRSDRVAAEEPETEAPGWSREDTVLTDALSFKDPSVATTDTPRIRRVAAPRRRNLFGTSAPF
jgi:hypothetical protein